ELHAALVVAAGDGAHGSVELQQAEASGGVVAAGIGLVGGRGRRRGLRGRRLLAFGRRRAARDRETARGRGRRALGDGRARRGGRLRGPLLLLDRGLDDAHAGRGTRQ